MSPFSRPVAPWCTPIRHVRCQRRRSRRCPSGSKRRRKLSRPTPARALSTCSFRWPRTYVFLSTDAPAFYFRCRLNRKAEPLLSLVAGVPAAHEPRVAPRHPTAAGHLDGRHCRQVGAFFWPSGVQLWPRRLTFFLAPHVPQLCTRLDRPAADGSVVVRILDQSPRRLLGQRRVGRKVCRLLLKSTRTHAPFVCVTRGGCRSHTHTMVYSAARSVRVWRVMRRSPIPLFPFPRLASPA